MTIDLWALTELKTIDLGDTRLNSRIVSLLITLSSNVQASIATACKNIAETKAAYRLFSNPKTNMEKVMTPHRDSTLERIAQEKVVVIAQDTTQLDFTGKRTAKHLGKLCKDFRPGWFFHPSVAFTLEKVCLGVVGYKIWSRDLDYAVTHQDRKKVPLEQKESLRWVEGYQFASEVSEKCPDTHIVNVADREGDMYDLYQQALLGHADYVIRAYRPRSMQEKEPDTTNTYIKVWDYVSQQPNMGEISFEMSAREERTARTVTQTVYCANVTLKPPFRKFETLDSVNVNAVMVREENPPEGEEPVQWLLLTSLPINNLQDVKFILDCYLCRWQIECFFKTLKSGCQVEKIQMETPERVQACIALYIIIAWRILMMTMLCRVNPEAPCTIVFTDAEWKSVMTVQTRKLVHTSPPSLLEMVKRVASFGSYQNRKGDGYPGISAIWMGLQRLSGYAEAWQVFGPEAKTCG